MSLEPVDVLLTQCAGTPQTKAGVKPLRGWVHIPSYLRRAGVGYCGPVLLLTPSARWLISCTQIMAASFTVAGWLKMALGHS